MSPPAVQASVGPQHTAPRTRMQKRPRVAAACKRCSGLKPCTNCQDFGATCEYLPPRSMIHREQRNHSPTNQAVENRLAELESIFRSGRFDGDLRMQSGDEELCGHYHPSRLQSASGKRWLASPTPPDQGVGRSPQMPKRVAVNTVGQILTDLSAKMTESQIDTYSQITMGRMIGSIIQARSDTVNGNIKDISGQLSPKSQSAVQSRTDSLDLLQITPNTADKLFDGYTRHIATSWPILEISFLRSLHAKRSTISDTFSKTMLHLIYAIGGRFLETTGEKGDFSPEKHYNQALRSIDHVLQLHDVRSAQFLLLLSVYAIYSSSGPSAWTCVGLAMRICIDFGMHRKARNLHSLHDQETRNKVFWSCYCLDRQLSIILGRPFAISDGDINLELPLDINKLREDIDKVSQREVPRLNSESVGPTSMTEFIDMCQLRQIESNIHQTLYRIDSLTAPETETVRLMEHLEMWKKNVPSNTANISPAAAKSCENYLIHYHNCIRLLLHPLIVSPQPANVKYFVRCAEACGSICRAYKKRHQSGPVGFSIITLHSIFISGLTLIYCAWAAPKEVLNISSSNDMNACSIVLYIITERWQGAKKYRDLYESIKQTVLESLEDGQYQSRRPVVPLQKGLRAALEAVDPDQTGSSTYSISAMVTQMAGGLAANDCDTTSVHASDELTNTTEIQDPFRESLSLGSTPLEFQPSEDFGGAIFTTSSRDWAAP